MPTVEHSGYPNDGYRYTADERPAIPGSPYSPRHAGWSQAAYVGVGILVGICSTFPNALTNVNVSTIAGSLGLYVA
jgi:hypothetical protein